jgi:hypothetical protein
MADKRMGMISSSKRKRILNEGTNMEILWMFLEESLELRTEIEYHLNKHHKITAIKCLKKDTENRTAQSDPPIWPTRKFPSLREFKDTIDRYSIRYNITKKLKRLRQRVEDWCRINGHDNIGYQKEVKDNKTGEYTYRYSDWEFIDDHYGLMINDWGWLPHRKEYKSYNKIWKKYSNVRNFSLS